jgi:flagellin-like protein
MLILEDDNIRLKYFWKEESGVSPVIAVILLVAMTVVLVAVLYYTVSGMIDETKITPVAAISFREDDTIDGEYIGRIVSISSKVFIDDVSLTLVDAETGTSEVIQPLVDGGSAEVGNPGATISLAYDDAGKTGVLDSSDVIIIIG